MKGRKLPLLFLTSTLVASDTPPGNTTAEPPAVATPPTASGESPRPSVSPETSARVTAELPKFDPVKITAPPPRPGESPLVASPNNGDTTSNFADIVQLPRYEVRDDPLPAFRERELLTPEGRVDLALKRHPGFKLGPLARLNVRRALEWLAEEEQAERNREAAELVSFQRFVATLRSDPPPAAAE